MNDLLTIAKEGTAYLLIVGLIAVAFKLIKEYPAWRNALNAHELQMKELENSKEKEIAVMMASAMDKNSQALTTLTKAVEGLAPIMERLDIRCEHNSQKLNNIGFRFGMAKPRKYAKQERGESSG